MSTFKAGDTVWAACAGWGGKVLVASGTVITATAKRVVVGSQSDPRPFEFHTLFTGDLLLTLHPSRVEALRWLLAQQNEAVEAADRKLTEARLKWIEIDKALTEAM